MPTRFSAMLFHCPAMSTDRVALLFSWTAPSYLQVMNDNPTTSSALAEAMPAVAAAGAWDGLLAMAAHGLLLLFSTGTIHLVLFALAWRVRLRCSVRHYLQPSWKRPPATGGGGGHSRVLSGGML